MQQGESRLVWIDLEMTGLNPDEDKILEIATLVTNNSLDVIGTGPTYVIYQSDHILSMMDDWNVRTHTYSGLIDAVKQSQITIEQAEEGTLNFLQQFTVTGISPLCGNSVWQDRFFLKKFMPRLESFLNYRIVDVSSIKEIIIRWYPKSKYVKFEKPENHRALEDIMYSIEELRHYRTYFFLPS